MGHSSDPIAMAEQKKFGIAIVLIEIFCVIIHGCVGEYVHASATLTADAARYPMW